MKPNPLNAALRNTIVEPDGDEPAPGDEMGDISESQDSPPQLEYIKEFVGGLDDQEFAYLQDCIAEKLSAKDKPTYRSPEKVKESMDAEGAARAKTSNDDDGDEEI